MCTAEGARGGMSGSLWPGNLQCARSSVLGAAAAVADRARSPAQVPHVGEFSHPNALPRPSQLPAFLRANNTGVIHTSFPGVLPAAGRGMVPGPSMPGRAAGALCALFHGEDASS